MAINIKGLEALEAARRKIEELKKPIDEGTATLLGASVVSEMLRMIQSGLSPIEGVGRFPGYKNPDRYPGKNLMGKWVKPKTPVNLTLSGDFLAALDFRIVFDDAGKAPEIGYFDAAQAKKEQGHREGANGQLIRPTIPLTRLGEQFSATINRVIRKIFNERIKSIVGR